MTTGVFEVALQYGMAGVVIILLVFAVKALFKRVEENEKRHNEERERWYIKRAEADKEYARVIDAHTEAIRDLRSVIRNSK